LADGYLFRAVICRTFPSLSTILRQNLSKKGDEVGDANPGKGL